MYHLHIHVSKPLPQAVEANTRHNLEGTCSAGQHGEARILSKVRVSSRILTDAQLYRRTHDPRTCMGPLVDVCGNDLYPGSLQHLILALPRRLIRDYMKPAPFGQIIIYNSLSPIGYKLHKIQTAVGHRCAVYVVYEYYWPIYYRLYTHNITISASVHDIW